MNHQIFRGIIAIGLLILTFPSNLFPQNLFDRQRQALDAIADFADRLCPPVSDSSSSRTIQFDASASADLNQLLKKLTDVGVKGAVKYRSEKFQGLLQKDLAGASSEIRNCRLAVLQTLQSKLVPSQLVVDHKSKSVSKRKTSKEKLQNGFAKEKNDVVNVNTLSLGNYSMIATTSFDSLVSANTAATPFTFPEANQQPAKSWSVELKVDGDYVLKNPRIECDPMGDQRCEFIRSKRIEAKGDQFVSASGLYQSRATTGALRADKFKLTKFAKVDTITKAAELFSGKTFTLPCPIQANCSIVGKAKWGDIAFGLSPLAKDSHLRVVSAGVIGAEMQYTMLVFP